VFRPRLALLALLLAAAFCAQAAPASALINLDCPGQTSQPFLKWLDPFYYTLAEGGDVDAGAPGWTLKNAKSILEKAAPALANGDLNVLGLGSGASATSPETCVSLLSPTMRFMVRSTGSPLGILVVSAVVHDGNGLLSTLPLGVVTGLGNQWKPSLPMLLATSLIPNLGDNTASVRFRFTTIGLGASFQVDDVYVDPYRKG
jgi:hypothetical protein